MNKCKNCGKIYMPTAKHQQYCQNACRQMAFKARSSKFIYYKPIIDKLITLLTVGAGITLLIILAYIIKLITTFTKLL